MVQRLILILVLALSPALLHAQDKDKDPWPDEGAVVFWQENGIQRQAWQALDEIAIFRGKMRGKSAVEKFLNDVKSSVLEKDVLFMNSFVSVIRNTKLEASQLASPRASETILRQVAPDSPARPVSPVFYPQGQRIPATRMALTGEIIVRFDSVPTEIEIETLAKNFDLTLVRSVSITTYLYQAVTPWKSLETANALNQSGIVGEATPHWYRARSTRQSNDPLSGQMWHLENTGQGGGLPGVDVNVVPVWETFQGSEAQVVGIVDGAVEIGHEDLHANVRAGLSWDFVEDDDDPSGSPSDAHGTACSGIAVARGFNGIGGIGAAPLAGLAGIRLLGAETDLNEALAFSHNNSDISVYSNSWGPADDAMRLEGPGILALQSIKNGTETGRGGKGNIYVWAGGNGRQNSDNSNYDGYANLRQTLAIGATTDQGVQASYSEPGANILINAPSSGGQSAITTTDHTGQSGYSVTNYTAAFGGTSAAAPMVSGVIALMLEANPNLTWRDVRWILAHTAQHNDATHSDWSLNGARMQVNHSYGFGRVDALAAVTMSEGWSGLGSERSIQIMAQPNAPIPDNDPNGVSSSVEVEDDFTIEFVDITFSSLDHPFWGDLEVVLTSPAGTRSILAQKHQSGRTYRYDNWKFGSTRHLGEGARGTWTLTVRDLWALDTGTFAEWKLHIHGHDGEKKIRRTTIIPILTPLLEE